MLMPRQSYYPAPSQQQQSQQQQVYDPSHHQQQQQQQQQQQSQQQHAFHLHHQAQQAQQQPPHQLISSLQQCVNSTAGCVSTMQEAITCLDWATQDHPRLITVLKSRKHFDLVSEKDIAVARSHVSGEVLPHVNELVSRANVEIERQERRAVALRNKAESQTQRLQNIKSIDQHVSKLHSSQQPTKSTTTNSTNSSALGDDDSKEVEELKTLQAKLVDLKNRKLSLLERVDHLEKEEEEEQLL